MKAELKNMHSPDVDLDSYWPDDPENFGFLLQAMIGPEGQDGEESFDLQVCTPDWLKSNYSKKDIVSGRHILIVFSYDLTSVKNHITGYCRRLESENWLGLANKLNRLGRWEFEDYEES